MNIANGQTRQAYIVRWQNAFDNLQSSISAYEKVAVMAEDRQQVTIWKSESKRYHTAVKNIERAINAGTLTTPEAANQALIPAKDSIRILSDSAATMAQTKAKLAQQSNVQLTSMTSRRMYLVAGIAMVAFGVALGWSWVFITRLLRPITALHNAANKLAEGDVTSRVSAIRDDEMGRLAKTFNGMAETIQKRTQAMEEHNARLQEANEQQHKLLLTIKHLSSPLLPVTDKVVVLPIVGHVDSERAQDIMTTLLKGVSERRAQVAILDISGILTVDTHVVGLLLQTIQAVGLLGTEVLLTGISAQMAQVMTEQGVQLAHVRTFRDLQMALSVALSQTTARY